MDDRENILNRIELINAKNECLESHHKNMERQLEDFLDENDRISR